MTACLILTGAPGSGKSSVLDALSTLFEIDGVEFGAIETEQLARGWPWLPSSEWLRQLATVISLQREARRETFLIAATTETELELEAVIDAVAADRTLVVGLSLPADLAARRIAEREPDSWPGKAGLIEHARELAETIPSLSRVDVVLPTVDREAVEVAAEIKTLLVERGLVTPRGRR